MFIINYCTLHLEQYIYSLNLYLFVKYKTENGTTYHQFVK